MSDYLENSNSINSDSDNDNDNDNDNNSVISNNSNNVNSNNMNSITSKSVKSNSVKSNSVKNDKDNDDFENTLNKYYKLKNKYEKEYSKNKKTIMNNKELSKREKQREFQRLKPKCINCKRVGGTIFTNTKKQDTTAVRILKAICGVHENPCNLKIIIEMSYYNLLTDILKEVEDVIKMKKQEIINYKNNILFGYSSQEEALTNFNDLKESISFYMETYSDFLDTYNSIIDNKETNEQIAKNKSTIQLFISDIKNAIIEFNKSNNEQFITDALNIYINQLEPLTKETMNLNYKENLVRYDNTDNVYQLIQNKYRITDMEIKLNTNSNKVVADES